MEHGFVEGECVVLPKSTLELKEGHEGRVSSQAQATLELKEGHEGRVSPQSTLELKRRVEDRSEVLRRPLTV